LVAAAFSGHKRPEAPGLHGKRLLEIRPDNLDEVMARLAPALTVRLGTFPVWIEFASLDDFHPDSLWRRLDAFAPLREAREGLSHPSTFAETARRWGLIAPAPELPPPAAPSEAGASLLEQIAASASGPATQKAVREDPWARLIEAIVAPHVLPKPDPRQKDVLAHLDAIAGELMRAVLHDPDFQALEAAWRSLFWLLERLEVGDEAELYILDAACEDVAADLRSSEPPSSELARLLAGEGPWDAVAALYEFAPAPRELELLQRLGALALLAGAPLVAAASPRFHGPLRDDEQKAWSHFRTRAAAQAVALAWPRFLLRLPYGPRTAPTDEFHFEEMPGPPEHRAYLWGNPAVAVACLLATDWTRRGGAAPAGVETQIEGLPVHTWRRADGGAEMQPCAEQWLTEREALRLLESGLVPLVSLKNRDAVRLPRLQSAAANGALLCEVWR
jgi:type VI secretion system protein ImpC